ncbi:hypothetical protein D3C81_2231030 [compost metagenome]
MATGVDEWPDAAQPVADPAVPAAAKVKAAAKARASAKPRAAATAKAQPGEMKVVAPKPKAARKNKVEL